eukprot:333796-Pleurochrysis_carterae.AAC.2
MLACGVFWSAKGDNIYLLYRDRPPLLSRYLISKSGTPTKRRQHAAPIGYLPTIYLLTRRLPTI